MKNLKYIILQGIVSALLITSCYYDSEENLYGRPGGNCVDTTVFTFAAGVQPILSENCYVCHNNENSGSLGGGIRLQNYADVKAATNNGRLLGAITHTSGFSPMPKGGRKLDDCRITVIRKWIEAGGLNN